MARRDNIVEFGELSETIEGRVVGYDERTQCLQIIAKYPNWKRLSSKQFRKCTIKLTDGRKLSSNQRNACYALMRDIADYSGESLDNIKGAMKAQFAETSEASKDFSLSNADMTTIRAFQRFLVRFILDFDIPTKVPLVQYVDDVESYIYGCLVNRKCCVCGKKSDLHHVQRVGAGRNRDEIIHEGMRVLPLCRDHHIEVDQLGDRAFYEKYHLESDGIVLDKNLCRIYGLKSKPEGE